MKSLVFFTSLIGLIDAHIQSQTEKIQIHLSPFASITEYSIGTHSLKAADLEVVSEKDNDRYNLRGSFPIVVSRFEDTLLEKGWGILDVETTSSFHDGVQAFAAGFAEGWSTAHQIYPLAKNMAETLFAEFGTDISEESKLRIMPDPLVEFFYEQELFTYDTIQEAIFDEDSENFDYYFHVGLVMEQFDGLVEGYNAKRMISELPPLPRWAFHMLNGNGDMNDLIPALMKTAKNYNYFDMDVNDAIYYHGLRSRCSAMVKVTPGNEDLLMGHNTWAYYSYTNRIFKHYTFNFNNKATAAKGVSFSSYPGFLESLDDFYMLSSGLSWTQTSNAVLDRSVYKVYTPKSLLAWQRVRVASAMSFSGKDFLKFMKPHFSGSYANQYIVVDYNLFEPGQPLKDNTLWVVEEMPGLIVGEDVTEILRFGYWPSYNVPYYKPVWEKSGYKHMTEKFGDDGNQFFHSLAPRAEIFRRDQSRATDVQSFKELLRYNDFMHDEYSEELANNALCSRYDLLQTDKNKAYGCYDAKVTSFKHGAMQRKADIISGPTSKFSYGASYIEPFSWANYETTPHEGLPETYHFKYMTTQPFYTNHNSFRRVDE